MLDALYYDMNITQIDPIIEHDENLASVLGDDNNDDDDDDSDNAYIFI